MSHFTVGVFTKSGSEWEIEEALEPYQENNMDNCPSEYLEFYSEEKEGRNKYENESQEMFLKPNGEYDFKWNVDLEEELPMILDSQPKKKVVPFKELYKDFDEFMQKWYGTQKDYEKDEYGYWENPNAKWDWYVIGGRWEGSIKTFDGLEVNTCLASDIVVTDNEEYQSKIRFWELVVEDDEPKNEHEKEMKNLTFYSPKYYTELYESKEDYAERTSKFYTYAFLTVDGEWNEPGEMGWFALSDETQDSKKEYEKAFFKYLEYAKENDLYLTVVDCHI